MAPASAQLRIPRLCLSIRVIHPGQQPPKNLSPPRPPEIWGTIDDVSLFHLHSADKLGRTDIILSHAMPSHSLHFRHTFLLCTCGILHSAFEMPTKTMPDSRLFAPRNHFLGKKDSEQGECFFRKPQTILESRPFPEDSSLLPCPVKNSALLCL